MNIDLTELVKLFRETAEEKTLHRTEVTEYVMRHILEPMRRDETVLFENLDFSRFAIEDISNLQDFLQEEVFTRDRLRDLNKVFCSASPASSPVRAFC